MTYWENCWHSQRVGEVINIQALSISEDDFWATHTPFKDLSYLAPVQRNPVHENALHKDLQQRTARDEHAFVIIEGIPGTGKSNLIRWLAMQYEQQKGEDEIVLTIRREDRSLREVIIKIMEQDSFQDKHYEEQIRKLRAATDSLSHAGLREYLLSSLSLAVTEKLNNFENVYKPRLKPLGEWFKDRNIQSLMMQKSSPIERLALKLVGVDGLAQDEFEFKPDDFRFPINALERLTNTAEGYDETKRFTDLLQQNDKLREAVAEFCNKNLDFVIGKMFISADVLEELFKDLRRELKQQGKRLALFLEDITAMTGLDAGLIEALTTDHRETDLCRVISVVGLTDNYYQKYFPDNKKQRVSLHVSLNNADDKKASQLLSNDDSLLDLSARYLNAMRLQKHELRQHNGTDVQLPIRCNGCPVRAACHTAFGTVEIEADNGTQAIGLYPFNRNAIKNMYNVLDDQTPRELLRQILYYVLHHYEDELATGSFPPVAEKIEKPNFKSEARLRDMQQRTVLSGYVSDNIQRERIITLVGLWGDQSINTTTVDGTITVGGVPHGVFEAFRLPFPAGDVMPTPPPVNPIPTPEPVVPAPQSTSQSTAFAQSATQPSIVEFLTKHDEDAINRWLQGGELYEQAGGSEYRKLLLTFISTSIEWQDYGVLSALVRTRLNLASNIYIDRQATRRGRNFSIQFPKPAAPPEDYEELAQVLIALIELNHFGQLQHSRLAAHLLTVRTWLRKHTDYIVEQVTAPALDIKHYPPLLDTLLGVSVQSALLAGVLTPAMQAEDIYYTIMTGAHVTVIRNAAALQGYRPGNWMSLLKTCAKHIDRVHEDLRLHLDQAQGDPSKPTYLGGVGLSTVYYDVQPAIASIRRLLENNLRFETVEGAVDTNWEAVITVARALQQQFHQAANEQVQELLRVRDRFDGWFGDDNEETVYDALNKVLKDFKDALREPGFTLPTKTAFTEELRKIRGHIRKTLKAQNNIRTLLLSEWGQVAELSKTYSEGFQHIETQLLKHEEQLTKSINQGGGNNEYDAALQKFDYVHKQLTSITGTGEA